MHLYVCNCPILKFVFFHSKRFNLTIWKPYRDNKVSVVSGSIFLTYFESETEAFLDLRVTKFLHCDTVLAVCKLWIYLLRNMRMDYTVCSIWPQIFWMRWMTLTEKMKWGELIPMRSMLTLFTATAGHFVYECVKRKKIKDGILWHLRFLFGLFR